MSELLLHEKLRDSAEDDEARKIARVRTITVLTQLDARRIGYVFTFLREAGLMSETSHNNVMSLSGADLHGVNWSQANLGLSNLSYASLREANLSYANLAYANLSNVKLIYADLERVNLMNATVSEKQLAKAKTLTGAIMPDGSIHP
jgi:uncharacterized protein YjbI with pentapeptide repeats